MLLKRELARAWSSLKLEEHKNRNLPKLTSASNQEEYLKKAQDDLTHGRARAERRGSGRPLDRSSTARLDRTTGVGRVDEAVWFGD